MKTGTKLPDVLDICLTARVALHYFQRKWVVHCPDSLMMTEVQYSRKCHCLFSAAKNYFCYDLFPRSLVSASQDGKLIVWDSYTTNKVPLITALLRSIFTLIVISFVVLFYS